VLGVIPFMFLRYGDVIRAKSAFCGELARKKAELELATEVRIAGSSVTPRDCQAPAGSHGKRDPSERRPNA
jgi:hypothetical protein